MGKAEPVITYWNTNAVMSQGRPLVVKSAYLLTSYLSDETNDDRFFIYKGDTNETYTNGSIYNRLATVVPKSEE